MKRWMFSYSERPHWTALTIVEKESSRRTILLASLATSVPAMPIARPTSAFFSAGATALLDRLLDVLAERVADRHDADEDKVGFQRLAQRVQLLGVVRRRLGQDRISEGERAHGLAGGVANPAVDRRARLRRPRPGAAVGRLVVRAIDQPP